MFRNLARSPGKVPSQQSTSCRCNREQCSAPRLRTQHRETGYMSHSGPSRAGTALPMGLRCSAGRVRLTAALYWSHISPAPQSSSCSTGLDDAEQRLQHKCRTPSTSFLRLTRAGPHRLLIRTVALFRMAKRVPVAQHHFRHPCAPRHAVWPVPTRRRLPLRQSSSRMQALLTGVARAHAPAGPVLLCSAGVLAVMIRHRSCHGLPPMHSGRSAPRGAPWALTASVVPVAHGL